jgi:hypothetical protein
LDWVPKTQSLNTTDSLIGFVEELDSFDIDRPVIEGDDIEYTVPSVTAFLGLGGDKMSGDLASSMVNSIANLCQISAHLVATQSKEGRH